MNGGNDRKLASAPPELPLDRTRSRVTPRADMLDGFPRRLDAILRMLPASELDNLIRRMGIQIDAAKRIDPPSQVARALVALPDVRDPSRLSASSCELLHRIAEAGGRLVVPSVPGGLEPLVARGVVFGRRVDAGIELVLPAAYLLQMKCWEGEDPRALRALIAQAPFETMSAIASHYLGRPATPPIALSLEAAWEVLSDPDKLRDEIERLAPVERRLLEAVEEVGGEVDTQELLDLEREPLRLRGAGGVTATRRGAGFALERRAFLLPVHPNRHVVPAEVAALVGSDRHREREARRAKIRSFVLEEDHLPRRARFALDPGYLAVALTFAMREPGSEVRPGVGTPRSLVVRLAQRFGRDVETVALVAALSRAIGLWDPSACSAATPPGAYAVGELAPAFFATWRRGGAWDEARPEREALRVAEAQRDASPIGALREMVIESLAALGEGRWVPWHALRGYLAADARIAGIERLLRRWAERSSVEVPSAVEGDDAPSSLRAPFAIEIMRRIALETLPALGVLDLGGDPQSDGSDGGVSLRLTPRGRALVAGQAPTHDPAPAKFVDTHVLRTAASTRVAALLGLAPFAEIGRAANELDLVLNAPSIARALSAGLEGDLLKSRIEAVAPLPDTISRMLVQASTVIGKASFAPSMGFLWIEDEEIRELLRTRKPASELFVDPSPPGGLLIAADVDLDRLVRRCRSLGVEIQADGAPLRAKLTPPPGEVRRDSSLFRAPRSKTPVPKR